MATVADMVPRVRVALGVNASYDADTIPYGIRRAMKRLLRDYNFPKSVVRKEYTNLILGSQQYTLPEGFKRPLLVQFFDPTAKAWSEPLKRREGFVRPRFGQGDFVSAGSSYDPNSAALPYASWYWLEGMKLWTDTPLDASAVGLTLQVFYQSMLLDENAEAWMLADMDDLIFSMTISLLASENRKPEVQAAFDGLRKEQMQSIAIYANELEWNGLIADMHEARDEPQERYGR